MALRGAGLAVGGLVGHFRVLELRGHDRSRRPLALAVCRCGEAPPVVRAEKDLRRTWSCGCTPSPKRVGTFWARLAKRPNGCWEWQGHELKKGHPYGRLKIGGRNILAHRFAWELTNGAPPADLCVCHECDNPRCCNPGHLFLGTLEDNNHDRHAKGRSRGGAHCGTDRPNAKLTPELVRYVRRRRAEGALQREIAAELGVTRGAIDGILRGKTWKSVEAA